MGPENATASVDIPGEHKHVSDQRRLVVEAIGSLSVKQDFVSENCGQKTSEQHASENLALYSRRVLRLD